MTKMPPLKSVFCFQTQSVNTDYSNIFVFPFKKHLWSHLEHDNLLIFTFSC